MNSIIKCSLLLAGVSLASFGVQAESTKAATQTQAHHNAAAPKAAAAPEAKPTLATTAEAPSLKINGFSAYNIYAGKQNVRENGKTFYSVHQAVDVSDIRFTITGVMTSGLEYKYRVNLQAIPGEDPLFNANYISFKHWFGEVLFGNVVGPEDSYIKDAESLAGGTGGFNGGQFNVINKSVGVFTGNDISGDTNYATKIMWNSPEFGGIQIGVAFTPNTARRGNDKMQNLSASLNSAPGNSAAVWPYKLTRPYGLNNLALGIIYKNSYGDWRLTLSGAVVTEKSFYNDNDKGTTRIRLQDAKSYQLGFIIGYKNFQFGGGYLNNGKSRLPREAITVNSVSNALGDAHLGNAGEAFNVGGNYKKGAYVFGLSYQQTFRKTDAIRSAKGRFVSASAEAAIAQGLAVYTEANFADMKTNDVAIATHNRVKSALGQNDRQVRNNSAVTFITGVKMAF
ncbi:MAG TPA: hypothetical protein VI959_03770 [Alphaproteobacteria bacterium]|nr:hypothetical protein [Alphaproteobacteria bacterium]